ncbi:MAG: hypothetical protein E7293_01770 [Lachnospiraceae bacterium]|nr:hypothetical protein [Lachnospiraceae bacterium]
MARETIADKIAKKTFNSPDFQKSWAVHMQAFGPILEPAFAENYQARVHLTAALNLISRRDFNGGLKKLQSLQEKCINNNDKAALLLFMGLAFEMGGQQRQMVECYTHANEYGHRFYMPYLKMAKFYMSGHMYDSAEENFRSAIDCFTATGLDDHDRLILGSAYTNLATCLTMMHRYEKAETAIATSATLYPDAPGRFATEALLYAIKGDVSRVEECLSVLKHHAPDAYDSVKESTDNVLARKDPLFYPVPLDGERITGFWTWFGSYVLELNAKLDREEYETALAPVAEKLLETFPFFEEAPYIALGKNEVGYVLELRDMYAIAVENAYKKLMEACPEETKSSWQFSLLH